MQGFFNSLFTLDTSHPKTYYFYSMDLIQAQKRMTQLVEELNQHNHNYYLGL
jgi:hypothetical protein